MISIPNCCAMPAESSPGAVYDCPVCDQRYRHLPDLGWLADGPIVELHPYETVLNESERMD